MARISLKAFCDMEGIKLVPSETKPGKFKKLDDQPELMAYVEPLVTDSVCPALCDEGCEVEPDGVCEHDAPSLLIALGLC
jgi:hypothetical protein